MLVKAVEASKQWKLIYRDNDAEIFVRDSSSE
jgi:hypothetical protein